MLRSSRQLDLRFPIKRDAFVLEHALDHGQIPSDHLGEALDRVILEVEGDLGEPLDVTVARADHEGLDAAVEDRTAAHRARLGGAIEHAVGRQGALLERLRRAFDRQRLGMRGGVRCRHLQAARAADDLAAARDDRAERLLAGGGSRLRFLNGNRHEALVIIGHVRPNSSRWRSRAAVVKQ